MWFVSQLSWVLVAYPMTWGHRCAGPWKQDIACAVLSCVGHRASWRTTELTPPASCLSAALQPSCETGAVWQLLE